MGLITQLLHSAALTLFPRGSVRRVWRGRLRGMRFIVRDAMGVSFAMGVDSFNRKFLLSHIRPGDTVYDVGANRGQMARYFSRRVGATGRVISFEPIAALANDLDQNCRVNQLKNVTCVQAAPAEHDGFAVFDYDPGHSSQGKLHDVEPSYLVAGAAPQQVETVRLDTILERYPPPTLVKIDVEGGAASVLRGARELIAPCSPRFYIELHGPDELVAVQNELTSRGYRAFDLKGNVIDDPGASKANPMWCVRTP